MESGGYPPGAEFDPRAPYNQVDLPEKEIEVTVSITLSKTIKVLVNDYEVDVDADEDGMYQTYDFSNCDLQGAVEKQYPTPDKILDCLGEFADRYPDDVYPNYKAEVFKGWNVDEMEVIEG